MNTFFRRHFTLFELLQTDGRARRGRFTCAHGTVETPVFMNVGTQAAIKGGLAAEDLEQISCPTPITCTSAPAKTLSDPSAVCTAL